MILNKKYKNNTEHLQKMMLNNKQKLKLKTKYKNDNEQ